MRRTKKRRYSESDTFLNPITVNLSTRPFAPSQSDISEDHEILDSNVIQTKLISSEDLLSKLMNVRGDDTSSAPIQKKPENRLKAIRSQKLEIQAKLNIGEPNDKYEKEADLTATKVVQQINSSPQEQSVQRNEAIKGEEELQMQSLGQRHENLGGGEASTDLESSIQSARGSGQSLDPNLQTKMGQAMGADFRDVKVHTDSQSDQLNKSIQAKAFTKGNDVFFRHGAYDPSSRGGQELIAHELTHVVQQNSGSVVGKSPDQTIQRKLNVKLKKTRWFQGKDQKMLGEERLKNLSSNDEALKLLDMETSDRVQRIIEAFTTGMSEKDAFKQIALFIEGKDPTLVEEFNKTTGDDLKVLINEHFKGKPQEKSADYLISILDNNGRVPLKSQIWLVLGMVDGSPSDDERLVYLSEKASATEWISVWQDLELDIKRKCEYKRTYERLKQRENLSILEDQKSGVKRDENSQPSQEQIEKDQKLNQAISLQRDRYLAAMIRQRVTKNFGIKTGLSGQKILADILKWKETATPEDIEQIKKPNSEFQKAIRYIPGHNMMSPIGLNSKDRMFLRSIASDVKIFDPLTSPNVQDNKVEDNSGLTGKVEDQKPEDNKTGNDQVINNIDELKREDLIKIFTTKEALTRENRTWFFERLFKGDKWDSFESEIRFMTPAQRKGFLRTYDQDPVVALQKLEEEMKQGLSAIKQQGIDKSSQAVVLAHFDDRYGEVGSNYEQLLRYTFADKWDKRNKKRALTKDRCKKKILKILARLRDEEYAQVRQNQKLLVEMKGVIGSSGFEQALKLLGMKDENDQLNINPETNAPYTNEEVISKANREHDVNYWVSLLLIKDKPDYSIFFRAQRVARAKQRQFAKEDNSNENYTKEFLQNIYFQSKLDSKKDNFDKPLSESDPDLYKALYEDKDLEVNYLLKKANDRKISVDRAKTVFAFNDLDGRTLLEQWSNLKDYKSNTPNLKDNQIKKAKLEEDIAWLKLEQKKYELNLDKKPSNAKTVEGFEIKIKSKEEQSEAITAEIEKMELKNKSFVLGMSESKRLQLIKMKRMTTEDRLQIEQLFNEKLVEAISSDTDAQQLLLDSGLPFDQWMATKLMSTNAILKQRKIDKTRQWDSFHNKSSQLDEGTRMVVGTVRSGDTDIKEVENDQKLSPEEKKLKIKELKSKYSKQGEEDLQERKTLESQFKDIQSRYNARVMLLAKILTTAAIMAATMGAGGAITIGIQVALLAAQAFINAGVRYFVLKENIGKTVGIGVLDFVTSATMLVGLNLGDALQASLLSTQNLGQGDFLAPVLSKGMVGTMKGAVLALPKVIYKELFDRQPLGDVVDKGKEKTVVQNFKKELKKVIMKNILKTVNGIRNASITEGEEQALSQITGIPMQNNSKPHKDFATANKDVFTTENDPHKLDQVLTKDIKKTVVKDVAPKINKGKAGERLLIDSDKNEKGDRRDRLERIRRGENTPVSLEPLQKEQQSTSVFSVPIRPDILEMATKLRKEKEAIKREEKQLTKQLELELDEQKKQIIRIDLERLKSRKEKLEEHKEQLKKDKELQKDLEKEENERLQSARYTQELEAEKKFLERKQLQETEERKQQEESQQNPSSGNVQDSVNTVNTVKNVQDPVKKLEIDLKQAKTNSALKLREIDEAKQKIKVCGETDKSLETTLKQVREQRDELSKNIKSTEDAIANIKKKDNELVKTLKGNDGDTNTYKLINANNMELRSLNESLEEMKSRKIDVDKSVTDNKKAILDNKEEKKNLEMILKKLEKECKNSEKLVKIADENLKDAQKKKSELEKKNLEEEEKKKKEQLKLQKK